MKSKTSKAWLAIAIILLILILDQIVKIWVKTHMYYGESIQITDWFYIRFIENNGMAYGLQLVPKAVLSIFRIIFSAVIIWYIYLLAKANFKRGIIISSSLIFAGAAGNIIDGIFYGVLFNESTRWQISTFVDAGEGYAGWLHGRVVDMLYFPLFELDWPTWIPFIGGEHYLFFNPVFNIADSAVCCGVAILFIFYRNDFARSMVLVENRWERLKQKLRKSQPLQS